MQEKAYSGTAREEGIVRYVTVELTGENWILRGGRRCGEGFDTQKDGRDRVLNSLL
jgi:hypothetical protein